MNPARGWDAGVGVAGAADRPAVVKCGGSLLSGVGWQTQLRTLHGALDSAGSPLLVVGGGAIVDGLRAIDAACPLDPTLVHDLAIGLLGTTARLVAAALDLPVVVEANGGGVLDVAAHLAVTGQTLPVGWHVTSDSIAARVAAASGRPLVLLKSVPPPPLDPHVVAVRGWAAAVAATGWVDPWFPAAAAPLRSITWASPTR